MIEPGMHLNAIGGDCPGKTELHRDVRRRPHRSSSSTRRRPASKAKSSSSAPDFPVTELWQVLAGTAPGRTSRDEVTLFDSVGFAIEDFSTLRFVRDLTRADRRDIDLVPDLADPKDLFSLLAPSVTTTEVRTPLHA